MEIFTKEQIIEELKIIREKGWIKNTRPGNAGGVGNTLEDLLGIEENNLPIPNAAEWELKAQRANTSSPRALRFVPQIFLLKYGWPHQEAGNRYSTNEMSFRQNEKILMLQGFSIDKFVEALEKNNILVDFDARTGHNHGTKFRLRQNVLPDLYKQVTEI